jgi:enediyne biosynthesis protein E4
MRRASLLLISVVWLPDGIFSDVTYRVGIPDVPTAIQADISDIDNDGWEDIVFLGQGVFINRRGKIFQNAKLQSNLSQLVLDKGALGVTGACAADFDRDGLIDLYVTRADTLEHKRGSWIDGKSGNTRGNQLLRNLGQGQFEDVTEKAGASGSRRSTFTAAWHDANHDGWPDLYVIHEFGADLLLVNQQDGSFRERQLAEASQDFGSMGLATGDMDNDGAIDINVSNMYSKTGNRVMDNLSPDSFDGETMGKLRRMVSGSELHVNEGGLRYKSIGWQSEVADVGWSWGAALVDLNNDGLLDIHSTAGFMSYNRRKPDG